MSSTFRDPQIVDGEKSVYSVRVGNQPPSSQTSNLIEHDEGAYVSSIEAGSDDSFSMKVEQRFRREGGNLTADSYRAVSSYQGNVVSREEGFFVDTKHMQFGGNLDPFPSGVMPLLGGLTMFRGLDFRKGAKSKHDLWLAFSVSWPIEAKVEKRLTVDVPAGSFDAWQVNIRPSFSHINGLLDKVISGFLPPFIGHFETGGSHRMVRFSFPSGPMPWNPKCVLELSA